MPTRTVTVFDPIEDAITRITHDGIQVVSWPPMAADPPPLRSDRPTLYVVAATAHPPYCSVLEDWVRQPVDVDELRARARGLQARARRLGALHTVVDEDDTLRIGDEIVILSHQEATVLRILVEHLGEVVGRDELVAATWPDGPPSDPRALDNRVNSLRRRLEGLPLVVHTVRGRGLLLERLAIEEEP